MLRKAKLDGVFFTTNAYQSKFKTNNSCVSTVYNRLESVINNRGTEVEINKWSICYGVIQSMFLYDFKVPGEENKPEVFVECDWYETTDEHPVTKLIQVVYNSHFQSCRLMRLTDAFAMNLMLWPTHPFKEIKDKSGRKKTVVDKDDRTRDEKCSWDVIHHRQRPVIDRNKYK